MHPSTGHLDHQSLDLVLERADLVHEIRRLVGGDAGRDDSARDTAGAAERSLRGDVDVWHVLVLAEEGEMEEDGERGRVGGEDDDLGDTTVERLGRLVGTLLQLTVVAGLLDNVEDLLGEGRVGDGPGWEEMLDSALDEKLVMDSTYRHQSFVRQTCCRLSGRYFLRGQICSELAGFLALARPVCCEENFVRL